MFPQQGAAVRHLVGVHRLQPGVQDRFKLAILSGVVGCGIQDLLQVVAPFPQLSQAAMQQPRDRAVLYLFETRTRVSTAFDETADIGSTQPEHNQADDEQE